MTKVIAIAADHAGFELKTQIISALGVDGYQVIDLGTHSTERVDYPDYGHALADMLASHKADLGIGICGTGIGISIALNRNPAIRAAVCHDAHTSTLARQHNDANVLCLGARILSTETALECVRAYLNASFEGGRHADRVKKLGQC